MENKELLDRAKKAGIDVEVKDCAACGGEGRMSHPDPIDLKRWREKHGVLLGVFAASVKRPGAKHKGVSIGFISMVENFHHKQFRRCPDWLLEEYLAIPDKKWPKPKNGRGLARAEKTRLKKEGASR